MGQKINPHGMRVGIIKNWDSRWYSDKDFADQLLEDYKIRKYIKKKLYTAGISSVEIEKAANRVRITINTAKPGMVIGKGGSGVEQLKDEIESMIGKKISINVMEVKNPDIDSQLIAENIASQLERRISFRRAMKQSISRAMRAGALGIKTMVSGRLGGSEIARTEWYHEGTIPLQTLRADIDYGFAEAYTTYGRIGVKVWVYKGEVLPVKDSQNGREGGNTKNVNAKKGKV